MTTTETSPGQVSGQASTRHIRVDARFATILSEDFGIPAATILDALVGEPQKQAIAICTWASRTEDPAKALLCWARKHQKGRCRRARRAPGTPSRRHGEISGSPREDTDDRSRGSGPTRPEDSLRSILAQNPGTLERIAARLGA